MDGLGQTVRVKKSGARGKKLGAKGQREKVREELLFDNFIEWE